MRQELMQIKHKIFEEMDLTKDLSDEELLHQIRQHVGIFGREHYLSLDERVEAEREIFHSFRKLDILQELLDRTDITEILVNGPDRIFYEKSGQLYRWEKSFDSVETLGNIIQTIVGSQNRSVNEAQPIVDTRLADGSRVNIVLQPVALNGPILSIRKFSGTPMTLERLIQLGSLSPEMSKMLKILVRSGYNLFVSGGTGSGKTTFLNALSQAVPNGERVVTIEDSAELQLTIENLVRMETRSANLNGTQPITIRDLIRTALRMRPDRIIVGEVRGAETLDMLQAINTGHSGSMSTGHANSIRDMLSRLETMALMSENLPVGAIRGQIAHGLDVMIHLGRLRDHSRKVLSIQEIAGMENGEIVLNPMYRFLETGVKSEKIVGCWEKENSLIRREKLQAAGLEEEYSRQDG